MGKKNREKAKEKAKAYLATAQSDGKLTKKEVRKATKKGLSMDKILSSAASGGIRIGGGAKDAYGINQGNNTNRIDYTPGAARGDITNPISSLASIRAGKSGPPAAQKRGLYAGVDKKGQHVYRYDAGQPRQAPQASPTPSPPSPGPAQEAAPQNAPESFTPSTDPQGGKSWNDFMAGDSQGSDQGGQPSYISSYGSGTSRDSTDANNPNLHGAISNTGVEYQKRFGRFIDYAQQSASAQAGEIGRAGREALTRLQATPPKIQDPLSEETAKAINRFGRKLKFK